MKTTQGIFLTIVAIVATLTPATASAHQRDETPVVTPVGYRHGDCTWVEPVALRAGWELHQIPQLIMIIKRESGCCPNRRGGDAVDKNCNVTHVTEWTHRSDTGATQVNGLNYDSKRIGRTAYLCKLRIACTQVILLDPFVNLLAARALFNAQGWSPWEVRPRKP